MFKQASIGLLAALSMSSVVQSDEYKITLGGFYASTDSTMLVKSAKDTGNYYLLDFEDDLLLAEDQFLPFLELQYSFNDRHHIYVDWKSLHRDAETSELGFDIEIPEFGENDQNVVIDGTAKVSTTLNIDILRIGYGYDIWEGNDYTVGASIGLHTMFVETIFEGNIGICEGQTDPDSLCEAQSFTPEVVDNALTAPLPNIGVYGSYEFYPGWVFNAHAQYFTIKYDNFKGSLVDIRAGVQAQISENWHLSLAYNYYDVDVDIEKSRSILDEEFRTLDYNINYSFTGPMFAVSYSF
ncbi:outer membrane beta-barrel protein [Shewanella donghaensis]|uniref:outer membrane beta-barrel protein n=1 Tax=Shewanella donghaensis TaxID=238836 RepID=UPI001183942A|nr:outer membrane beta-barrel protein [Shewanella donghaensis]